MYQGALVKVLRIYENNVSIQLSNAFFDQFYMEMNAFANDVFGYEQMLESNEKGKKREMIKKILGKFKMNGASLEKFKEVHHTTTHSNSDFEILLELVIDNFVTIMVNGNLRVSDPAYYLPYQLFMEHMDQMNTKK
ncbi:uncharacterized protein LOC128869673 [Anastrepha ludens]|uniref:uncharacterized protein LOC128869673 n=1 Tax=Anastrepha ludens TaxID=28586 RepID=UPI0023B1EC12|nr:uncharacterized protein LOC128869673 [Anastrepha ludens]